MRSVLVIGATGLVGSECIRLLVEDPTCSRIVVVARSPRPVSLISQKIEWNQCSFDELASRPDCFDVDQIICAMGTTVSKTPSRDEYRKIDYEYPLTAARLGRQHGARHFLIVTAVGANARSPVFYNRLKGEVEDSLMKLDYPSVTIARPSVLIGDRKESRRSEKIAWKLGFLMPKKYKPVKAASVARALVDAARQDLPGVRILQNKDILQS
ncbi:MAG TPA: hypothetical protein VD758_03800 [Gemmatimonadaceae bacterium]|nr:hypothetical protein [Gemmatimonadaceae bacterium]